MAIAFTFEPFYKEQAKGAGKDTLWTVQVSSKANEGKVRCNARKYAMGAGPKHSFAKNTSRRVCRRGGRCPPPTPPRGGGCAPPRPPLILRPSRLPSNLPSQGPGKLFGCKAQACQRLMRQARSFFRKSELSWQRFKGGRAALPVYFTAIALALQPSLARNS